MFCDDLVADPAPPAPAYRFAEARVAAWSRRPPTQTKMAGTGPATS